MSTKTAVLAALGAVGSLVLVGAALWLALRDAPTVSAKEAVQAACEKMDYVNHYDMDATIKYVVDGVPDKEHFTLQASVSGEDYAAKWTASSDGATGEITRIAGKGYIRESIDGRGWEIFPGEIPHINNHLGDLGATLACPSLDKVNLEDTETDSDSFQVKRYSSGIGAEGLADAPQNVHGHKESSAYTFWVDANGLLVKHLQERHQLATHRDGRVVHEVMTTTTTYSGHGEPNTITAPVLGQ